MKILEPKIPEMISAMSLCQVFEKAVIDSTDIEDCSFKSGTSEDIFLRHISVSACRFINCRFVNCKLEKMHFGDVIFENCDFSNIVFDKSRFNRVEFKSCKLVGSSFVESVFDHVAIEDSIGKYANFFLAVIRNSVFMNTNFTEAIFTESKFSKTVLQECHLERANFMHAELKDLDFRDSNIDGAYFMVDKLKDVTVSYEQAVMFAEMLGLNVK